MLADAPLQPESISPGEEGPVSAVSALVRTVHERADQARVATSAVDREAIFGELMTTCSACHQWLGGGPPSR